MRGPKRNTLLLSDNYCVERDWIHVQDEPVPIIHSLVTAIVVILVVNLTNNWNPVLREKNMLKILPEEFIEKCDHMTHQTEFSDEFANTIKNLESKLWEATDEHFMYELTQGCGAYKTNYTLVPPSKEEQDYPIAYILIVNKDLYAIRELLHAIYEPQNHYCIHVDATSSDEFKTAIASIISVFLKLFKF